MRLSHTQVLRPTADYGQLRTYLRRAPAVDVRIQTEDHSLKSKSTKQRLSQSQSQSILIVYDIPTMSVATMLPTRVSRASTSSSSSLVPVSRQNTVGSSHDGRSVRQSKRYSTALYLSMSAKEKELEIEDDLARGIELFHPTHSSRIG